MKKEFYNYIVYDDGRVYSNYRNKFLKPDIVNGYKQYSLSINKKTKKFKAHRLVGMLFIPNPYNLPVINHMDGNKLNNHVSNLEWCTQLHNNRHAIETGLNNISKTNSKRWEDKSFRERTSKNISESQIRSGCHSNEKNGRFKYRIYMDNKIITRKELPMILNLCLSRCDVLIKEAAQGKIADAFIKKNIQVVNTKESSQTIEMVA